MTPAVAELLERFDRHSDCVPLDEIVEALPSLDITLKDVDEFVCFSDDTYQRHLIHTGPAYQALILCWGSGQRSPIHDHRGSACGVRVLQGTLSETVFARSEIGLIYANETRELLEGSVCGSFDSDIHQVSNLQPPSRDLVTLHIYSPPLLVMGTYSLIDGHVGEFVPKVHEFTHGAGI